jgi:hypothetical protein
MTTQGMHRRLECASSALPWQLVCQVVALTSLLAPASLLGPLGVRTSSADVAALVATRDNTLFEDAEGDTSNGAGPSLFAGRNSQGRIRRALIAFDPGGVLPVGATLDSAVVALHLAAPSDEETRTLHFHRALASWGEGASSAAGGAGAPAAAGDATWLHRHFPEDPWSAPGGDFEAIASAATTVGGEGVYRWRGEALTHDVRAWLADPAANFGWLVRGEEDVSGTARRIESRDSAEPPLRPRLLLYHSMPTPAFRLTWARVKAHYR